MSSSAVSKGKQWEIVLLPDFGHTSHFGVEPLHFVERHTLVNKSSCHKNLGLHLGEFMLNRLCKNVRL